eukprot:COSAG05_NODE_15037_length_380_cov_0.729537_1_plen_95_part_00
MSRSFSHPQVRELLARADFLAANCSCCCVALLVLLHRTAHAAARQRTKWISPDDVAAVIMLTFFQTLALLLQIELTWPAQLRKLMLYLSYFSKY